MFYSATVNKNVQTGMFEVEGYSSYLLKIPGIDHSVFEGIDTADLEKRLAGIDWNKAGEELVHNRGIFTDAFYDLILLERLYNQRANAIASQLMLKYWMGTSMEDVIAINMDLSLIDKHMFFPLDGSINDVDALQAYNLLDGRAVRKFDHVDTTIAQPDGYWITLKGSQFVIHKDFDIVALLKQLPVSDPLNDETGAKLVRDLMDGNRPEIGLMIDGKVAAHKLEVDPKNRTLIIEDKYGILYESINPKKSVKEKIIRKGPGKNRGRSI